MTSRWLLPIGLAMIALRPDPVAAEPAAASSAEPARICLQMSSFVLGVGEHATLKYQGAIHGLSIRIDGPSGSFAIEEHDIRRPAPGAKKLVLSRVDMRVYRISRDRYEIYGRVPGMGDKDRFLVHLSGSALNGSERDAAIYSRVHLGATEQLNCAQRYRTLL